MDYWMVEKLLWCLMGGLSGNSPYVTCWKSTFYSSREIYSWWNFSLEAHLCKTCWQEVLGEVAGCQALLKSAIGDIVCTVRAGYQGGPQCCRSCVWKNPWMPEEAACTAELATGRLTGVGVGCWRSHQETSKEAHQHRKGNNFSAMSLQCRLLVKAKITPVGQRKTI